MSFLIRPATEHDLPEIQNIYNAEVLHGMATLHEKFGFVQTGYMPQVGQKFGQWRDLVLMQLLLNQ